MQLETLEFVIHSLGGLLAYLTLGAVFYGIWRGMQRQTGLTSGHAANWLHSPWFYLVTSAIFFAACILGWTPLPLTLYAPARGWLLALGSLLYFPGMALALWSRLALGKNYFVSTGMGTQLFKEHQLVTHGPFAYVRHPMYLGIIFAALGSLLLYHTWTTLLFACFAPFLVRRARREEQALAQEFGESWHEYCNRVPLLFPRLGRKRS
jgi:protein-S-isoprenylcysteine O-methyltransferase Ste14